MNFNTHKYIQVSVDCQPLAILYWKWTTLLFHWIANQTRIVYLFVKVCNQHTHHAHSFFNSNVSLCVSNFYYDFHYFNLPHTMIRRRRRIKSLDWRHSFSDRKWSFLGRGRSIAFDSMVLTWHHLSLLYSLLFSICISFTNSIRVMIKPFYYTFTTI